MKYVFFLLVCTLLSIAALAQRKVVIIGSSTAEGEIGTTSISASFVELLKAYYPTHTFINRAFRGTNTYNALPASVPGKPAIDPTRNITEALTYNPDVILVSYPTNDVAAGFTNAETVANLQTIYSTANAAGVIVYILGTQPRDFVDAALRTQLSTQNDLIKSTFPLNTIDIYPDLVRTGGYRATEVAYTQDLIHLNDEGHRRIFQKVVAFNIFQGLGILPVTLTRFDGQLWGNKSVLNWETSSEVNNSAFRIERSQNGTSYTVIGEVKGKGNSNTSAKYTFTDPAPAPGKNYYRLQQLDLDNRSTYSRTVILENKASTQWQAFPIPAHDKLNISTTLRANTILHVTILSMQGLPVYSVIRNGTSGYNIFSLPIASLPGGSYNIRLATSDGTENIRFIKQ